MTADLEVPAWLAVLALLAVVVLVVAVAALLLSVRRTRARTEQALAAASADAAQLREQLAAIEERLAAAGRPGVVPDQGGSQEFVITGLGVASSRSPELARTVAAPMFADIVARESVIKTVSVAAGLRRALSPEVRNRIRFEMKREVKRSRKQRRADRKQARREWEAHQRAQMDVA